MKNVTWQPQPQPKYAFE